MKKSFKANDQRVDHVEGACLASSYSDAKCKRIRMKMT